MFFYENYIINKLYYSLKEKVIDLLLIIRFEYNFYYYSYLLFQE